MGFRLSCDCASGPYMDDQPDETIVMTNEDTRKIELNSTNVSLWMKSHKHGSQTL